MAVTPRERAQAARDLRAKLELEAGLRRRADSHARTIARSVAWSVGRGKPLPDVALAHRQLLEGELLRHHERVEREFSGRIRERLSGGARSLSWEDAILSAQAWRTWERSSRQAERISRTTAKLAARAVRRARRAADAMEEAGEEVGLRDLGAMAGRFALDSLSGRSEGIASHETQSVAEAAKAREALSLLWLSTAGLERKQLGDRPRAVKEWVSQGDSRVRRGQFDHLQADSVQALVDEPFQVSGELLMHPGDASLGASLGNLINCRCAAVHDVEEVESARQRAFDERCELLQRAGFPGLELKRSPSECPLTGSENAQAVQRMEEEISKTEDSVRKAREKISSIEAEPDLRGQVPPKEYQRIRTSQGTRLGIARKSLAKGEARLRDLKQELGKLRASAPVAAVPAGPVAQPKPARPRVPKAEKPPSAGAAPHPSESIQLDQALDDDAARFLKVKPTAVSEVRPLVARSQVPGALTNERRRLIDQSSRTSDLASLSEAQRKALNEYRGIEYASINESLRSPAFSRKIGRRRREAIQEQVRQIDAAIEQGTAAVDEPTLWRGIQGNYVAAMRRKLKVGTEFTDKAFTSWSVTRQHSAKAFADGALMKVKLRKGDEALWIGAGEAEVLVKRGKKFRVARIDEDVEILSEFEADPETPKRATVYTLEIVD